MTVFLAGSAGAEDLSATPARDAPAFAAVDPSAPLRPLYPEGNLSPHLPPSLEEYHSYESLHGITGAWERIVSRAERTPFNVVASVIFLLALFHTFLAGPITRLAHRVEEHHRQKIVREGRTAEAKPFRNAKDDVSVLARVLHLSGEVEAIFGLWLVPLMLAVFWFHGYGDFAHFVDGSVNYTEAVFVVVIMAMAASRPILRLAENGMRFVAGRLFGNSPAAWWLSILVVGPLLGSFITEPAAMTISAILLSRLIYRLGPSEKLKYATLALLFVNISVGGTLSHFAAPPVLMVAGTWGWDTPFMIATFGWKAFAGILVATGVYYLVFRREFAAMKARALRHHGYGRHDGEEPVPRWVTLAVVLFMAWTVGTSHHAPLFVGGFLFFLAFHSITRTWQGSLDIKGPLMVGFFLAALVTHGTLQQWWIEPLISALGPGQLFLGSGILTAFNDNAAITFLASQVPALSGNTLLQYAVVCGAVSGGGLTLVANAPNPAGQSILHGFFGEGGISPLRLFIFALLPTLVVGAAFWLLP
ncbi:MAG TPA: putative Na+/H+ antiporter [Opitutales bacterium]|nr:putative Na+/H+ antiporter [Opitutales bacterium]